MNRRDRERERKNKVFFLLEFGNNPFVCVGVCACMRVSKKKMDSPQTKKAQLSTKKRNVTSGAKLTTACSTPKKRKITSSTPVLNPPKATLATEKISDRPQKTKTKTSKVTNQEQPSRNLSKSTLETTAGGKRKVNRNKRIGSIDKVPPRIGIVPFPSAYGDFAEIIGQDNDAFKASPKVVFCAKCCHAMGIEIC